MICSAKSVPKPVGPIFYAPKVKIKTTLTGVAELQMVYDMPASVR